MDIESVSSWTSEQMAAYMSGLRSAYKDTGPWVRESQVAQLSAGLDIIADQVEALRCILGRM